VLSTKLALLFMHQLIVMRHGEAEPIVQSDAQRALTANGKQACIKAANSLLGQRANALHRLQILYSPYRRTTETANLVAAQLDANQCELKPNKACSQLLSEESPSELIRWLDNLAIAGAKNLMLVSHQPLVSSLLALLIEGASEYSIMKKYPMWPASVAVLELEYIASGCAKLISLNHHAQ